MIASMAQPQNLPQSRKILGIPPGGSCHKSLPSQSNSPIAFFTDSVGSAEYRNPDVQSLAKSASRWQSDLHISTRWPENSNESSGHGCPVSDIVSATSSGLFGNLIGSRDWQQNFIDASERYPASPLASVLSPGLGRSMSGDGMSSPLGSSLVPSSSRLAPGWNSAVDHGNLSLTVDPSKGGFALQGGVHQTAQSLARFPSNPGFAERAARFSAFGNGQYSPTFPLTENGNVGRSPSFENDSKRAKASVSGARSEFGAAMCSTDLSVKNSVAQRNGSDCAGVERVRNGRNRKAETKASGCRLFASSACSPGETDDRDEELNIDDAERATSESDGSDISRGQEMSCADQVALDHGRTCGGKKRKGSFIDESAKEASSPISKEHKSSGGQSKRSKDNDGASDKEEAKAKAERSGSENSGLSSSPAGKDTSKPAEQPKLDYIHVRARRGQATDSHSLAERVRREKISERMKFLQDLVPGCSKVTGKAVMLDEIINYVQSIQRQVEFLSMKLAAVTPRPDFNIDSFLSKQLQIGHGYGTPNIVERSDTSLPFPHIQSQSQQQPVNLHHGVSGGVEYQSAVDANLRRMNSAPMPMPRAPTEVFGGGLPQVPTSWDGDLQSVVQMGFGQSMQGLGLSGLQCDLPSGHVKMEL